MKERKPKGVTGERERELCRVVLGLSIPSTKLVGGGKGFYGCDNI